jgi:replicative DNA helicase
MALSLISDPSKDAARIPPHSADAERACLGSVLIKPTALDEMAELTPGDFFVAPHADIFEAMRALSARVRTIDVVTVTDELTAAGLIGRLEGGLSFLLGLANSTPTAENAKHYAATVASKAALRRVIAACSEIASAAYANVESAEDFLGDARQKLAGIDVEGVEGPVSIPDDVDRVVSDMEKRGLNPERFLISTGIDSVDAIITGLLPQTVTIIAANPSRGKTAWALNTIIRAATKQKVPCLFFSLEMSRSQIIERALAFQTRINGRGITQGKLSGQEWYSVETAAREWQRAKIPIWIDERVHAASRLCAVARRWRAQRRTERLASGMSKDEADLAVVAIDYLGLVRGDEQSESRRAEVAAMSRAFKALAKNEKLAVILCAQLNRQNMKEGIPRAPNLSDLRDAGEIEQDADVVLFPWWEGTPPDFGPFEAEILVRKNRNGPTGEAPIIWEREFMTFSDRQRSDYQETRYADAE